MPQLLTQQKPITTNLINQLINGNKTLIKTVITKIGNINICQFCGYGHTNIRATIRHMKKSHRQKLKKTDIRKLNELITKK